MKKRGFGVARNDHADNPGDDAQNPDANRNALKFSDLSRSGVIRVHYLPCPPEVGADVGAAVDVALGEPCGAEAGAGVCAGTLCPPGFPASAPDAPSCEPDGACALRSASSNFVLSSGLN